MRVRAKRIGVSVVTPISKPELLLKRYSNKRYGDRVQKSKQREKAASDRF